MMTKTIKNHLWGLFHPPILESLPVAKKQLKKKRYSTKGCSGDF